MTDRITIDDVRKAGYCVAGARTWFASYNISFSDFLKNGETEERLLATGDAMADRVVRVARERRSAHG